MPSNTKIKEMKLIFTLNGETLTRRVEDLNGDLIWESGNEVYCDIYGVTIFDDYEKQMKELPFWNIIEVEKNIT
mgnify:FL=1